MPDRTYSVVELVGTSDESWEHAARAALAQASPDRHDARIAELVGMDLKIGDEGAVTFRSRVSVSTRLGAETEAPSAQGGTGRSAAAAVTTGDGARPVGWLTGGLKVVVGPLYHLLWRMQIEGTEHLPEGGAIIAANHGSFFDSVALIMAVPRPISFVGKAEYLESWKTRRLLPALGMIPVNRTSGRQAIEALNVAARVLAVGGLFGIYPEGTRSRDGDLHAGRTGMAHLALSTGAPIIPTGILGTDRVQPPGARTPRPFRTIVVRFGTPILPANYPGGRRHSRRVITEDVMAAIQALTGQRYRGGAPAEPAAR